MKKAPWDHRLTKRLADLPNLRLTYAQAAKQVRNRLRRFSARSIVEHALTRLRAAQAMSTIDGLSTWPWITLLLVKLALEDEEIEFDRGEVCSSVVFDRCRQALWDAQDGADHNKSPSGGVYLMLRSMVQAQLQFQQKPTWGFIRWPALLARLDNQHPSRRQFRERFGMEPDAFLCICFATYAPIVNGDTTLHLQSFAPLRRKFGDDVDRFFDEFSKELPDLRKKLQAQRSTRLAGGQEARRREELNEFPWLASYPLLRKHDGQIEVWHPIVFARGMEVAVHKRLSERRGDYARDFSKVFESYVLELIDSTGLSYLSEAQYKQALSVSDSAVEAIITEDGANVFIEAKLTAHSEVVSASKCAPLVWTGLKRVREAMNQGWLVGSRLRAGATPNWLCTSVEEDFLIIVTSQPLLCATGEHFRRMFKHDIFDPQQMTSLNAKTPTVQQIGRLPLCNVIIASIEEFERLMVGVKDRRIQLVSFLREVAAANSDPSTSILFLNQLIAPKATEFSQPTVIAQAIERTTATVRHLLEHK